MAEWSERAWGPGKRRVAPLAVGYGNGLQASGDEGDPVAATRQWARSAGLRTNGLPETVIVKRFKEWLAGYSQEAAGGITAQVVGTTVATAVATGIATVSGYPYVAASGAALVVISASIWLLRRRRVRSPQSPGSPIVDSLSLGNQRADPSTFPSDAHKYPPELGVAGLPTTKLSARVEGPSEIEHFLKSVPPLKRKAVADQVYRGHWVDWTGRVAHIDDRGYCVSVIVQTALGPVTLSFAPFERPLVEPLREGDDVAFEGQITRADSGVELVRVSIRVALTGQTFKEGAPESGDLPDAQTPLVSNQRAARKGRGHSRASVAQTASTAGAIPASRPLQNAPSPSAPQLAFVPDPILAQLADRSVIKELQRFRDQLTQETKAQAPDHIKRGIFRTGDAAREAKALWFARLENLPRRLAASMKAIVHDSGLRFDARVAAWSASVLEAHLDALSIGLSRECADSFGAHGFQREIADLLRRIAISIRSDLELEGQRVELVGTIHSDSVFMRRAIELSRQCASEPGRVSPKVGAVVVKDGKVIGEAYRGELAPGEHAEFTALEHKLGSDVVAGATVFTTLEPCTGRNAPKIPCAKRLVQRKVARVVVGMLDPNPNISGRGVQLLRDHNISVELFPAELASEVEDLNHEFRQVMASTSEGQGQGAYRPADGAGSIAGDLLAIPGIEEALAAAAPGYRLPTSADLTGDWGIHYDAASGFPLICEGTFTGRARFEAVLFLLGMGHARYKIVLVTTGQSEKPDIVTIDDQVGHPQSRFVKTLAPGYHPVSPSAWEEKGSRGIWLYRSGIEVGTFESATCVYYWDETRRGFLVQWLSD